MAKSNAVIKNADIDNIVGVALSMLHRDPGAVAMIDCFRMNATPVIAFIDAIGIRPGRDRSASKVDTIDDDREMGGLDYWMGSGRYPVGQRRRSTPPELEFQLAARANDLAGIFQRTGRQR